MTSSSVLWRTAVAKGRPIFPLAIVRTPESRNMTVVNSVVVVFPFGPGDGNHRTDALFESELQLADDWYLLARSTFRTRGTPGSIPGLRTHTS